MKISTKLRVLSDRFFACSHGVGRGVHRGADGEGGRLGNSGVGATAWWGGGGNSGRACRARPVYTLSEDEKSKASDKNRSIEKPHKQDRQH